MENTHTTFVKATSLGIARLTIKALELSVVPPGGRFLHGINSAYFLCIRLFMEMYTSGDGTKWHQCLILSHVPSQLQCSEIHCCGLKNSTTFPFIVYFRFAIYPFQINFFNKNIYIYIHICLLVFRRGPRPKTDTVPYIFQLFPIIKLWSILSGVFMYSTTVVYVILILALM